MNASLTFTPFLEEENETALSFRLLRTTFSGSTLHVFFEMVDRRFNAEQENDTYLGIAMLMVISFLGTMIYWTRQWLLKETKTMEVQKSQPHQPNHESISNHLDNIADVRHERREVTKQQVIEAVDADDDPWTPTHLCSSSMRSQLPAPIPLAAMHNTTISHNDNPVMMTEPTHHSHGLSILTTEQLLAACDRIVTSQTDMMQLQQQHQSLSMEKVARLSCIEHHLQEVTEKFDETHREKLELREQLGQIYQQLASLREGLEGVAAAAAAAGDKKNESGSKSEGNLREENSTTEDVNSDSHAAAATTATVTVSDTRRASLLAGLRAETAAKTQALSALEAVHKELKARKEELESEASRLREEVQSLYFRLEASTSIADQATKHADETCVQLTLAEEAKTHALSELNLVHREMQAKKEELESEASRLREEVQSLQIRLEASTTAADQASRLANETSAQLTLAEAAQKKAAEKHGKELEQRQVELRAVEQQLLQASTEGEELRVKLSVAEDELRSSQQELASMRSAHDLLVAAHDQLLQTLAVLQAASPAKATATVTTATSPLIRLSALDDSIHSNIDNSSNQAGTATSPTVTVATAAAATACDVAQEMQQLQQLSSTGSTKPPTIEALRAMVEEVRSKRRWVRETLRQAQEQSEEARALSVSSSLNSTPVSSTRQHNDLSTTPTPTSFSPTRPLSPQSPSISVDSSNHSSVATPRKGSGSPPVWLENIYGQTHADEEGAGDGANEEGAFDYCSNMMHTDEAMLAASQLEQSMMTDLLSLRRSRDALRKNLFLATTCAADSVVPTPLPPRRYAHSDNSDTDDHITKQQSQAQPQQSQSQSQKQQSQSQLPSPKDMGGSHSQPPQSQSQPMPLSIPPPRIATHNTGTASKITGTPNTRARRFVVKTSAVATAFANLCKEKASTSIQLRRLRSSRSSSSSAAAGTAYSADRLANKAGSMLRGKGTTSAFLHPRTSLGSLSPSLSPTARPRGNGRSEPFFRSRGSPSLSPPAFHRSNTSTRYPTYPADADADANDDVQFLSLSNSVLLDQFDQFDHRHGDESYYNPDARTGTGSDIDTISCLEDHDHDHDRDVIMGDMYASDEMGGDLTVDPQHALHDTHGQNNNNDNSNQDKGSDPVPDPSSPTLSEKTRRDKMAFVVTPLSTSIRVGDKVGAGKGSGSSKGSRKGLKGRTEVAARPLPTPGKTTKSKSFFTTSKISNTMARNNNHGTTTPLAGKGNKNGGGTGSRMNFKDAPVIMSRLLSFRRGNNDNSNSNGSSSNTKSSTGTGLGKSSSSGVKAVSTPGLMNLRDTTKQPPVQGKAHSAMKSKSPFVRATQAMKQGLSFSAFRRPSIYGEDDLLNKKGSE